MSLLAAPALARRRDEFGNAFGPEGSDPTGCG
jgi:hypothetical protein